MKIRSVVLLILLASALLWIPVHSEAAIIGVNFTGSADWMLLPSSDNQYSNYVNTYDGNAYTTGKNITGYLEYDDMSLIPTKLWMNVPDVNNNIHRLEALGTAEGSYFGTSGNHVFEIQGDQTLTNLIVSLGDLTPGSTGTWYFDYDDATAAFRIGGSAQVVPIPAAVWLLGTGILGIATLRRKVQK